MFVASEVSGLIANFSTKAVRKPLHCHVDIDEEREKYQSMADVNRFCLPPLFTTV
jgi:hypothetical protein